MAYHPKGMLSKGIPVKRRKIQTGLLGRTPKALSCV
jgi:hypothetical protein